MDCLLTLCLLDNILSCGILENTLFSYLCTIKRDNMRIRYNCCSIWKTKFLFLVAFPRKLIASISNCSATWINLSWKWYKSNVKRIESEAMGIHYFDWMSNDTDTCNEQNPKWNPFLSNFKSLKLVIFFRVLNSVSEMRHDRKIKLKWGKTYDPP